MSDKQSNNLPADSEQEAILFEQLSSNYAENRDIANQLLGRVQMAKGIAKMADVVSLVDLQKIKEGKLYKALKGQKVQLADGSEIADVGSWEGFCKAVGTSKSSVDEQLLNLREIGEQALDQLTKVGMGVRDLRAIRQLSVEDRQTVIESEALELDDKEAVQDLIQELKQTHKKETSKLNKDLVEARNANDIKTKYSDKLSSELLQLKEQLAEHEFKTVDWKVTTKQALLEGVKYEADAMEALSKLNTYRQFIFENEDLNDEARQYLAGGLLDASKQLAEEFAQFWDDSNQMLGGYLPNMRPSIEALEELSQAANSKD